MAETGSDREPVRRGSEPRQPLSSGGRDSVAGRAKSAERRLKGKPSSGPSHKTTADLFAKEEQYKLINAELEAKTAALVRQAEQVMREQNEVLSKPIPTTLHTDLEDEEDDSRTVKPRECPVQRRGVMSKELVSRPITQNTHHATQRKERRVPKTGLLHLRAPVSPHDDDMAFMEDLVDSVLIKTVRASKELDDTDGPENIEDSSDTGDRTCTEVQIQVLRAKVRILQEELDQRTYECNQKDDENSQLMKKVKAIEEDRARLQKTTNIQQTQIEKHRASAEESSRKCDALQLQVAALQKEIESLTRAKKQAAGTQSSVEVRLNRALEEVERLKTQLRQMEQMNKEKSKEEHQSKEKLLAENKMLKKQKAELIVGFRKQLKLIDILKRQKMHYEAAKMLSFTEEEFMKALDWGAS
ncbi:testis-expressed protein 9 [Lampris incognitus]|uniref:testis-expressed protein 9 n=1 Tax=Lampris incognitus TaxID=2546036 RepID=UPI0024B61F28|nr:testis-expressed protein 9 [Lampris incognitus]